LGLKWTRSFVIARSPKNEDRADALNPLLLHFDAHSFPHAFENHIDGLDILSCGFALAIHDQLVLGFLPS